MSLSEARTILDTARAGGLMPTYLITQALGVTGDLSTRLPELVEPTIERVWPYYQTKDGSQPNA